MLDPCGRSYAEFCIEVRLDPRQAPARAQLLPAADFGQEARGRPIHGSLESEDGGTDEPGPWLKLGAVRDAAVRGERRNRQSLGQHVRQPAPRYAGQRPDGPPSARPVIVRTDIPDARGWRVYRVAPNGAVIYDGWIEHDPANAERRRRASPPAGGW